MNQLIRAILTKRLKPWTTHWAGMTDYWCDMYVCMCGCVCCKFLSADSRLACERAGMCRRFYAWQLRQRSDDWKLLNHYIWGNIHKLYTIIIDSWWTKSLSCSLFEMCVTGLNMLSKALALCVSFVLLGSVRSMAAVFNFKIIIAWNSVNRLFKNASMLWR